MSTISPRTWPAGFLIAGLCAAAAAPATAQDRTSGPRAVDAQTATIEQALETTTTMEFPSTPLNDVCQYLSELHKIPVLLDEPELSDAGVTPDQEIRLVVAGVTMRNALELLLDNVA